MATTSKIADVHEIAANAQDVEPNRPRHTDFTTVECGGAPFGCSAIARGSLLDLVLKAMGWRLIGSRYWCPVCLSRMRKRLAETADADLARVGGG